MGLAPENTLASFQKAIEDGAHALELDIHQSGDGEIVIIHDDTVDRTTNGRGDVGSLSVKDIKSLDAGYRLTLDGGKSFPWRGRGIEVPTLEEFFLSFPDAKAIVEIKQSPDSIVKAATELICRFGREDRVILASEEDRTIALVREELRSRGLQIATGFSFGEVAAFIHWVRGGKASPFTPAGQAFQIPSEYGDITLVDQQSVEAAHALGLEMYVWTVNEPDEMNRLLQLGVDGLITDYPERFGQVLLGR
jgi:glycerophosphoryl diester phosphodiesterase